MNLAQQSSGYRYNSDSLLLYDFITRREYCGAILDVGCGCGIIGALLKRDRADIDLWALDIQSINATITKHNFVQNNLKGVVLEGDFLNMDFDHNFDIILSNPPYYRDGSVQSKDEHKAISRYNQHLPLNKFFEKAKKNLSPRGRIFFCYDAKQTGRVIHALMEQGLTLQALQYVHPHIEKSATLMLVEVKLNSKSVCEVLPPFIMNTEKGYTDEAKNLFTKAATKSCLWV